MKVLGLVGSVRKLGNSEILCLTDYRIKPCQGFTACLFQGGNCVIEDDATFVSDKMAGSDGITLGVPCCILEATAVVKQLIDRGFAPMQQNKVRGKVGGIIVPYTTRGWTQNVFQQTNTWLLSLGVDVIDQVLIQVQGLIEAPLFEWALKKARALGRKVVHAIKTGDHSYQGADAICPICHDRNIGILEDMQTVECPVCAIRGTVQLDGNTIRVLFREEDIYRNRWTEENSRRHFTYHLKPSKDFFFKTKKERKEAVQRYRDHLANDNEMIRTRFLVGQV